MGGSVMASIINATTTGLTVTPDNSGQLTLSANGVTALTANTSGYLNFPYQPTIGGVQWPAFSAWLSNQSISSDTATKMSFNNEYYDTNSCYNNTGSTVGSIPSYSFLPNVAGYYLITISSYWASYNGGGFVNISLYKNNSGYTEYSRINSVNGTMNGSGIVYMNGTTDYIAAYWYSAGGTCTLVANNGSFFSNFSAVLVRAA